jgi:hypothetical protein
VKILSRAFESRQHKEIIFTAFSYTLEYLFCFAAVYSAGAIVPNPRLPKNIVKCKPVPDSIANGPLAQKACGLPSMYK